MDSIKCDYLDVGDIWQENVLNPDNMSFLNVNIRSLTGKFNELLAFLKVANFSFTFIVLTEVWLDSNFDNHQFFIPGYKFVFCLREGRIGGGIIIYYKETLNVTTINEKTGIFSTHESLCIKFKLNNKTFHIWAVYRPPSCSTTDFLMYMENNLKFLRGKNCFFMGDINLDVLCRTTTQSVVNNYIDVMTTHGFKLMINKATYFSSIEKSLTTCLDHIWHNTRLKGNAYIVGPPLADHMAIIFATNFCCKNINKKQTRIVFRDFSYQNKCNFLNSLACELERYFIITNNSDEETIKFFNWITYLADKYFPKKCKNVIINSDSAPWITRDIKFCIAKKQRWFRLLKAKIITYNSYKNYCNLLKRLLRAAECSYYNAKFESFGKNAKNNWKLLNSLMGRQHVENNICLTVNNESITDIKQIAEKFNDYFASLPAAISAQLPPPANNLNELNHINRTESSLFLYDCTTFEVEKLIKTLKGSDNDTVSVKMLKIGAQYFANIIASLFNVFIYTTTYPDILKVARITPIHKSGPSDDLHNYRPISILKNLDKLLERMLYNRLNSFLMLNNILSPVQFGFKKGENTETAILQLFTHILPAFQDCKYALCIYLDFSRAFDTVVPSILLKKLERYGVRGPVLELFRSFFFNRRQYVCIKGTCSDQCLVNLGVPQDSALGPLLFSVYINDLHDYLLNTNKVLYADDTTLILCSNSIENIETNAEIVLDKLTQWCNYNRLVLNVSKTKAMVFSNRVIYEPSILVSNIDVDFVSSFKYLGLWLDSKLKFSKHLEQVETKLARYCGIAYRIKSKLSLSAAKHFYYAFIYSTLSYCIAAWGGIFFVTQSGAKLARLQRRVILNLFSVHFQGNLSYEALLTQLGILKVSDIYRLRASTLMFSMLNYNCHPSLLHYLNPHFPDHEYATRHVNNFVLPFPNVDTLKISFKYQFLKIWNEIPRNIKTAASLNVFKKSYCQYLINQYV